MFGLVPRTKEKSGSLVHPSDNPFNRFRQQFDVLFDHLFGGGLTPWADLGRERTWGLDVEDTGKEVVVRAEAPGFEAGDFDMQLTGDVLTIRAERKQTEGKEAEGEAVQRWASWERTVTLPAGIDKDKVEAHYRNGILEVRLPRTPEAQGRRIEVKA